MKKGEQTKGKKFVGRKAGKKRKKESRGER